MEFFLVKAFVYDWQMPKDAFEVRGLYFRRRRLPWYMRGRVDPRIHHIATGKVFCGFPAPHWSSAVQSALRGVFRSASELLTFAAGTNVFFSNATCESESHVFVCDDEASHGLPIPPAIRVRPERQIPFLDRGMESLLSEDFRTNSRLFEALVWFNEPMASPSALPAVGYTMLWIALDTLMSAHGEEDEGLSFSRAERKGLEEELKRLALRKSYGEAKTDALLRAMSKVNERPVSERIARFNQRYSLGLTAEDIKSLARARHNIQHADRFDYHWQLRENYARLQRVVEEAVLRILNLEPEEYLVKESKRLSFPYFTP